MLLRALALANLICIACYSACLYYFFLPCIGTDQCRRSHLEPSSHDAGRFVSYDSNNTLIQRWSTINEALKLGEHNAKRRVMLWPKLSKILPELEGLPEGEEVWLRYCIRDKEDAESIYPDLLAGIARWEPAARVSSLRIVPDISCKGNFFCLCEAMDKKAIRDSSDALEVYFGEEDEGDLTGLGYWVPGLDQQSPPKGKPEAAENDEDEHPVRHSLRIHKRVTDAHHEYSINGEVATKDIVRWAFTHELGHAIGFVHEHQRPDARVDHWIEYHCGAMEGYEEVAAKVKADLDGDAFPKDTSLDAAMEKVCSDKVLAAKYNFDTELQSWMPVPHLADDEDEGDDEGLAHPIMSDKLDYRSAMIYDSMVLEESEPRTPILKHPQRVSEGETNWISAGGTRDYKRKSISMLDIERVSQLYPPTKDTRDKAEARMKKWIAKGEFEPVVFDVHKVQAEILRVLDVYEKAKDGHSNIKPDYELKPFTTKIRLAPTDAYDPRLDIKYVPGGPGYPIFGQAKGK